MWRSVLSVVVGFLVVVVVDALIDAAGQMVFHPQPEIDLAGHEAPTTMIDNLPLSELALILVALAASSATGGFVAALIARRNPLAHGLVVGVLQMGAASIVQLGSWALGTVVGGLRIGAEEITVLRIQLPTWFIVTKLLIV